MMIIMMMTYYYYYYDDDVDVESNDRQANLKDIDDKGDDSY